MTKRALFPLAEDPEAGFRDEFHRLLGRLVHAMARFDFNIGLQLNQLGPYRSQDVGSLLQTGQARLGDRLKRLRVLVLETYASAGPAVAQQFSDWFDTAGEARVLRNDYVHGRWAVPGKYNVTEEGRRIPTEPLLAFVPLDFDLSPDQPDKSVYMTLEEFAEQVRHAEALFGRYWELCERNIEHALPRGTSDPS